MRKVTAEAKFGTVVFNLKTLDTLKQMGYKYVQVKGLTVDRHYDYIEPHFLILVPFKEFSSESIDRGIYEPLESELLFQWATEVNDFTKILIANRLKNNQT
jgi:hypothetical protein